MVYHDISQEQLLLLITQAVQAELQKRSRQVPVGISVRHIHLTRDDVDKLFGYGYQLTPKKALSQPGQFACEECLDIIGPKGELKHVRILGPERSATQIELAQNDCRREAQGRLDATLQLINAKSKEIGTLMRDGKRDEAEAAKAFVSARKEEAKAIEAAKAMAEE